MMNTKRVIPGLMVAALSLALAACPPAPRGGAGGGRAGGGGGAAVNPNGCGTINTSDAGRKLYTFLLATAELDRQTRELEGRARRACVDMGTELGLPGPQIQGDTRQICKNVADGIKANLQVGLQAGAVFEVVAEPARCTVDVDAAARASAECEGKAQADVRAVCEGSCSGSCYGECAGSCVVKNSDGTCAGACEGTCRGRCEGSCHGTADVQAEATCEASAEVKASVDAQCTPPVLEIRYDAAVVVDTTKIDAVKRAIEKGLPELLLVGLKMQGVAKAFAGWAVAARDLAAATGRLAGDLGTAAVCVGGQLAAAVEAIAAIQVRVDITVQASVEVGGACSAGAGAGT